MTPVVPPIAAHRNSMEMSMSERAPGCISASSNFYLAQKNIPSLLDRNRRSSRIPISSSVSRTFLSERNARNTFSRRYTLTESGLEIRIVSLRESSRFELFSGGVGERWNCSNEGRRGIAARLDRGLVILIHVERKKERRADQVVE